MNKIERILAIIIILLDQEVVSATELAQRFDVTKRTIFRDIETIEYAGFPVLSHTGRNGGFSLVASFKLRTTTYDQNERQEILDALAIKEKLFGKDQTIIKEKISYHQKASSPIDKKTTAFSLVSPSMHRPVIEKEIRRKIVQINYAIREKRKVEIRYVDNDGKKTRRIMHPYELIINNGSWYLIAFCERRMARRTFKLTRIRALILLEKHYTETGTVCTPQGINDSQYLHLKFEKKMLGKLYDFCTDDELIVSENAVEMIRKVAIDETILPFILMFGANVTVLHPEKVRAEHQLAIEKMGTVYNQKILGCE